MKASASKSWAFYESEALDRYQQAIEAIYWDAVCFLCPHQIVVSTRSRGNDQWVIASITMLLFLIQLICSPYFPSWRHLIPMSRNKTRLASNNRADVEVEVLHDRHRAVCLYIQLAQFVIKGHILIYRHVRLYRDQIYLQT